MSTKLSALCLVCCLAATTPVRAIHAALEVPGYGFSGQSLTVSVHNANPNPVSTYVQVDVRLNDGTLVTLTSATVTIPGGATASVTLLAPQSVAAIEDDPEPIGVIE